MNQTLNITTTRSQLSELVNHVFRSDSRVTIEKSGIPVAAIVSTQAAARLDEIERQRVEDFGVLDAIQAKFANVPVDEHEDEVRHAIARTRIRLRAAQDRGDASLLT